MAKVKRTFRTKFEFKNLKAIQPTPDTFTIIQHTACIEHKMLKSIEHKNND